MSKIGLALRQEIVRLAGKQSRTTFSPLMARVRELRKLVSWLKKALVAELRDRGATIGPAAVPAVALGSHEPPPGTRLSPRLVAKLRSRLGLSQRQFATLLGVSATSVALWETGKARPVGKNRAAVAALRQLGRRQVRKLLEERAPLLAGKARRVARAGKVAGRKGRGVAKAARFVAGTGE